MQPGLLAPELAASQYPPVLPFPPRLGHVEHTVNACAVADAAPQLVDGLPVDEFFVLATGIPAGTMLFTYARMSAPPVSVMQSYLKVGAVHAVPVHELPRLAAYRVASRAACATK